MRQDPEPNGKTLLLVAGWLPYTTLLLSAIFIANVTLPGSIVIALYGLHDFIGCAAFWVGFAFLQALRDGIWRNFGVALFCAVLTGVAAAVSLLLMAWIVRGVGAEEA